MEETTQLTPDQRADLVAYLDGELEEGRTQEMERILAENATARQEVDLLTRTFSLLDALPRPTASAQLTARTMECLRVETATAPWVNRAWYHSLRRGLVAATWIVGLTLAGMAGYFAANRVAPEENVQLVKELPVIENIDAYSDVESIEFLQELEKKKVFNDDDSATQP